MSHPTPWLRWIAAALALVASFHASAQQRYEVDPTFNGGHHFADRFAGSTSANYQGRKLVVLANGDTVVAGRVSYGAQTDPAGWLHLGLVRYNASGQRVAWTGPGSSPYFHFNQQYVIYPKNDPSIPATRYRDVLDIAQYNGFLYVLVESDYAPPTRSVFVLVFRTDGTFVESHTIYGALAPDPRAAALAVLPGFAFAPARLLVIGTHTSPGTALRRIWMARYGFTANGGLTAVPMPGANANGHKDLPVPPFGQCNSVPTPFQCHMMATAIAHALPFGDIYIGGSIQPFQNSTDWDYIVTRVDIDGNPRGDFGIGSQATVPINLNSFGAPDFLADLVARPVSGPGGFTVDAELFLVGNAPVSLEANAETRIAIAKLGPAGALDTAFGTGGRLFIPRCTDWALDTCRATAAILERNRLIVAGFGYGSANGNPGILLDIGLRTGAVANNTSCHYGSSGCGGTIFGHAYLRDIAALPDGRLVAAGELTQADAGATQMFGTVAFRVRDVIFEHDFDSRGDD
jgi:hypothetical protein